MLNSFSFLRLVVLVSLLGLACTTQTRKFYMTVQPAHQTTSLQTTPQFATSSTGSVVMAAVYPQVFKSSYWGNGWMTLTAAPTMTGHVISQVAVSDSGQFFAFVDHYGVYISWMYGDIWFNGTPETGIEHLDWSFIGCSHSGIQLLTAAKTGALYYSHNSGRNFTAVVNDAITTGVISSLAVSSSGNYMIITMDSNEGLVWISSNAGVSWSSVPTSALAAGCYNNAVISYSGQYITVTKCGTTALWHSADYGATWGTTAPQLQWQALASSTLGAYVLASSAYSSTDGTASQVWVSSTNGYFWRQAIVASSSNVNYGALAVSGGGQYMIAGATNGWIMYSTNYGNSWTAAGTNGGSYASYSVASVTMSSTGSLAYAAVPGVGIFTSTNYGATWTLSYSSSLSWMKIAAGGSGASVVAVAATADGTLNTGYVVLSSNAGVSWATSSTAISGTTASLSVNSMGTMFLLTSSTGSASTVMLSSNSGVTFSEISAPSTLSSSSTLSAALAGNGLAIYLSDSAGNVYNSTSTGASWTTLLSLTGVTSPPALTVNSGSTQMIATHGGSKSYLELYTPSNGWGIPYWDTDILSMSMAASNPSFLMVGSSNNVYFSTSHGAFWTAATGLQGTNFGKVVSDYTGTNIFAFSLSTFRLYTTYAGLGLSMSPTSAPVPTVGPTAKPAASTLPLTLYQGPAFQFSGSSTVIGSSTTGSTVVVAGSSGVYVSSNYGASFAVASSTMTTSTSASVNVLAVNGTAELIALLTNHLYLSRDMGSTWSQIAEPNGIAYSDVAISTSGQVIITCQYRGHVYISMDAGVTFTSAASPLNISSSYWGAVALNGNGKYMLAANANHTGTNWGVAYYSSTYGTSWSAITISSVPFIVVYDAYVSSTGQYMFLTGDLGLYQSTNYGVTWSAVSSSFANQVNYMLQGYTALAAAPLNRLYMITAFGYNNLCVSGTGGAYWYVPTIVTADDDAAADDKTLLNAWSAVALNAQGTIMYAFDVANNRLYSTDSDIMTTTPTASGTPSVSPSFAPTAVPVAAISSSPTSPTFSPTVSPISDPTFSPTATPVATPVATPTAAPTAVPTSKPSFSAKPIAKPTSNPTMSPTTFKPTVTPSYRPTVVATAKPTFGKYSPTPIPTTSGRRLAAADAVGGSIDAYDGAGSGTSSVTQQPEREDLHTVPGKAPSLTESAVVLFPLTMAFVLVTMLSVSACFKLRALLKHKSAVGPKSPKTAVGEGLHEIEVLDI